MKDELIYKFSPDKNNLLKQTRGISFEDIIRAIDNGFLLDVKPHPDQEKYPDQDIYIIEIEGYACIVPFVQEGNTIFLKTAFFSRKATKKYFSSKGET